jgi:hypothetical protein
LTSYDKQIIIDNKKSLVNIIKKYEEEFNEDIVDKELTDEQIEELIDNKIPKYNRFTEDHPMIGVNYDTTINKYKIRF